MYTRCVDVANQQLEIYLIMTMSILMESIYLLWFGWAVSPYYIIQQFLCQLNRWHPYVCPNTKWHNSFKHPHYYNPLKGTCTLWGKFVQYILSTPHDLFKMPWFYALLHSNNPSSWICQSLPHPMVCSCSFTLHPLMYIIPINYAYLPLSFHMLLAP